MAENETHVKKKYQIAVWHKLTQRMILLKQLFWNHKKMDFKGIHLTVHKIPSPSQYIHSLKFLISVNKYLVADGNG